MRARTQTFLIALYAWLPSCHCHVCCCACACAGTFVLPGCNGGLPALLGKALQLWLPSWASSSSWDPQCHVLLAQLCHPPVMLEPAPARQVISIVMVFTVNKGCETPSTTLLPNPLPVVGRDCLPICLPACLLQRLPRPGLRLDPHTALAALGGDVGLIKEAEEHGLLPGVSRD